MKKKKVSFGNSAVDYYFHADFARLEKLVAKERTVIVTDEHVFKAH